MLLNNLKKLIEIELVPSSAWNLNLRKVLKRSVWDKIRRKSYKLSNYKCEICGGQGSKHPVECHEKWDYRSKDNINTIVLVGLESLCPSCHRVRHFGLSSLRGFASQCKNHMKKTNGWSNHTLNEHIKKSFKLHNKRSKLEWTMDIDYVIQFLKEE